MIFKVENREQAEMLDNIIDHKKYSVLIAAHEYTNDCADICIYYEEATK